MTIRNIPVGYSQCKSATKYPPRGFGPNLEKDTHVVPGIVRPCGRVPPGLMLNAILLHALNMPPHHDDVCSLCSKSFYNASDDREPLACMALDCGCLFHTACGLKYYGTYLQLDGRCPSCRHSTFPIRISPSPGSVVSYLLFALASIAWIQVLVHLYFMIDEPLALRSNILRGLWLVVCYGGVAISGVFALYSLDKRPDPDLSPLMNSAIECIGMVFVGLGVTIPMGTLMLLCAYFAKEILMMTR